MFLICRFVLKTFCRAPGVAVTCLLHEPSSMSSFLQTRWAATHVAYNPFLPLHCVLLELPFTALSVWLKSCLPTWPAAQIPECFCGPSYLNVLVS